MTSPDGLDARRTVDEVLAAARTRFSRLTPGEALRAASLGALIVDTRCEGDRTAEGVIPGSVHIPRTVLEWRADPASEAHDDRIADLRATLIVVCNDGYSSSLAAAGLVGLGFDRVHDMIGGFRAWKAAGFPVTPASRTPPPGTHDRHPAPRRGTPLPM